MKKILLVVAGVMALSGCGSNNDQPSRLLGVNVKLFDAKEVSELVELQKIPKQDVLDSLEVLRMSFKASYIGYNLKKDLTGKSGDEVFKDCREKANAGADKMSSYQLYDYVLQCLAGFKDTHLNLERLMRPIYIATGIAAANRIDNKLYISYVRPALLKKFEEIQKLEPGTLEKKLAPGNEIVAISGQAPEVTINDIRKFVSASSEDAEIDEAVDNLFVRIYNYPATNEITISVKDANGIKSDVILPWVQYPRGKDSSLESRTLLKERGFQASAEIDPDANLMKTKGLDLSEDLFDNLAGQHIFLDANAQPAMVTGIANINDKPHCYLQLNTFNIPRTELGFTVSEKINDTVQKVSMLMAMKSFLRTCEAVKIPLVFDLRENGGGNPGLGEIIFTYLNTDKNKNTFIAENVLNNSGNLAFLNASLDKAGTDDIELEQDLTLVAIKNSLLKNSPVSDWVAVHDTDLLTGIYTGKITALISPACISACDAFTNRLKLSGRALLVGTHSNGTGFGFSTTKTSTTEFQDQLKMYKVNIPNHSFQSVAVDATTEFKTEKSIKALLIPLEKLSLLENHPTLPDIELKYTLNDLTGHMKDYKAALAKIIFESPTN